MKSLTLPFFILATSVIGQAQDFFSVGLGVNSSLDERIIRDSYFGFSVLATRQKTSRYSLGFGVDLLAGGDNKSIDIPNNLLSNESLESKLSIVSIIAVNRFNLTPESRVKVFFDANLGLRLSKFTLKHKGDFLLIFPSESTLYEKFSAGIASQFLLSLNIPFDKSSHSGLEIRTGVVAGSPVKYIEPGSVIYTKSTYTHGDEKKSGSVFWVLSVNYVFKF